MDSLIAEVKDSLGAHPEIAAVAEVLADSAAAFGATDEAPVDTMIPDNQPSAIKTKRDTTQMDSLELAIYKYNKVIDDSLARATTPSSMRLVPHGLSSLAVRR